jgi:sigma-B regulation protein RsbU (phosphoserine phosphatase)
MEAVSDLIPANESQRLAAVRRYDVLDTPPDGAFDRVTKLAARHFDVPVSIVSIVDTDRIWFKSHHGLDVDEIGRDPGLCASAILGTAPWVVENAAVDPRTMANPLVAGEMGLRFYAGAPLTTHDGFRLGTLCVIDQQPREFSEDDATVLADLADVVMDELELRLAARATVDRELVLREQAEQMARQLQASLLPPALPEIAGVELASLYRPADAGVVGGDFFDVFQINDIVVLAVGDVSGKGPAAAAVTGLARHTIRSAALWAEGPAEILDNLSRSMLLGRAGVDIDNFCTVLVMFARRHGRHLTLEVASAGHSPALKVDREGTCSEVSGSGPPAGWYPEAVYLPTTVELGPGDRIVLYTDGLIEARAASSRLGVDGIAALLSKVGTAHDTIDALVAAIDGAALTVTDDIAALVMRVAE